MPGKFSCLFSVDMVLERRECGCRKRRFASGGNDEHLTWAISLSERRKPETKNVLMFDVVVEIWASTLHIVKIVSGRRAGIFLLLLEDVKINLILPDSTTWPHNGTFCVLKIALNTRYRRQNRIQFSKPSRLVVWKTCRQTDSLIRFGNRARASFIKKKGSHLADDLNAFVKRRSIMGCNSSNLAELYRYRSIGGKNDLVEDVNLKLASTEIGWKRRGGPTRTHTDSKHDLTSRYL